jgi:hypothetical protein
MTTAVAARRDENTKNMNLAMIVEDKKETVRLTKMGYLRLGRS